MSRDSLESCNVHSLLYLCDESVCHDAFGNDCMEFIFKPNNHQKNMIICNFLQVDDFFIIAMMLFVTSYQMFLVFSFSMLGTELTEAVISLNKLCTMTCFWSFSYFSAEFSHFGGNLSIWLDRANAVGAKTADVCADAFTAPGGHHGLEVFCPRKGVAFCGI